jgi:vancomycin permeability regulator SanA
LNGNFPFKLRFVIQFEVSEETTMEATELDVIIVLGVQLFRSYDKIEPAPHTTNRIKAATIAFQTGLCNRFIISGGYNVGISYSLETNTIFTTKRRDFKSCALARFQGPSKA